MLLLSSLCYSIFATFHNFLSLIFIVVLNNRRIEHVSASVGKADTLVFEYANIRMIFDCSKFEYFSEKYSDITSK